MCREAMLELEPYEAGAGPKNPGAFAMLTIYKWHLRKCNLLWYEIGECISNSQSYCYAGHIAHQR